MFVEEDDFGKLRLAERGAAIIKMRGTDAGSRVVSLSQILSRQSRSVDSNQMQMRDALEPEF